MKNLLILVLLLMGVAAMNGCAPADEGEAGTPATQEEFDSEGNAGSAGGETPVQPD